jgi:hypothetical protein
MLGMRAVMLAAAVAARVGRISLVYGG